MVLTDRFLLRSAGAIAHLAMGSRLPTIFEERSPVETGGLMAYGVNWVEVVRHAATYARQILQGAKPADLPVERPMKYELVINLKTAKALGITPPPSLLLLADEVLQIGVRGTPGAGAHNAGALPNKRLQAIAFGFRFADHAGIV